MKTPLGRNRVGLCSGYLRSLRPGDNVRAVIEKGPVSQCVMRDHLIGRKPLICVGPGTGIAPIRAITQSYLHHQLPNSNNLLTLVVFNGCRRRNKDTLFAEEWKQDGILVESDGKITNHAQVFMAFSQEGLIKEYVTHKIKQQGEIVWKLLSEVR